MVSPSSLILSRGELVAALGQRIETADFKGAVNAGDRPEPLDDGFGGHFNDPTGVPGMKPDVFGGSL
jgi:hypothetical protein